MRLLFLLVILFTATASGRDLLPGIQKILFLGDSITASGEYVDGVEAYLYAGDTERKWEIINAGLASETVSGLSEDGHAGGQFPRPDLQERLARVLSKAKPQLVFICYGMNDGIYMPLQEARFARFREGMEKARTTILATGARVIHLTPPPFDSLPLAGKTSDDGAGLPFHGYDTVLEAYSAWLLSQRENGWEVIDVHQAMQSALVNRRMKDPQFRFANDGVHPSEEGHWVITRAVIEGLNGESGAPTKPLLDLLLSPDASAKEYRQLVRERGRLLHHAWLTETGHQRPGISPGLPLPAALEKAARLEAGIQAFLKQHPSLTVPTPNP